MVSDPSRRTDLLPGLAFVLYNIVSHINQVQMWYRLTSENFEGGHKRQNQQQHRQQLAKTPLRLALIRQLHTRTAKCLRQHYNPRGGANRHGHEHQQTHTAYDLAPRLPLHVQVPCTQSEDDGARGDDGNCPNHTESPVTLCRLALCVFSPDTPYRQCRRQILHVRFQHEHTKHNGQEHVDEHGELPQPPQNPISFEVLNQGHEGGEVGGGREERQHPDDEEVVGYHAVNLGQPHHLDADALDDLLVRETRQDLAGDVARRLGADFGEDDEGGEDQREAGGDDEGEEDLFMKSVNQYQSKYPVNNGVV